MLINFADELAFDFYRTNNQEYCAKAFEYIKVMDEAKERGCQRKKDSCIITKEY